MILVLLLTVVFGRRLAAMAVSPWAFLFYLALVARALAQLSVPAQAVFSLPAPPSSDAHSSSRSRKVLESDVHDYVQKIMKEANVPGMSIAIVHSDWDSGDDIVGGEADTEYGSFGIKSEEGDAMTSDVSPSLLADPLLSGELIADMSFTM